MNKIKCIDREISFSNVETMRLLPQMDFLKDIGNIVFHPKGERFYKKYFWSKKESFVWNMYDFNVGVDHYTYNAKGVVKMLKEGELLPSLAWEEFFHKDINVLRKQVVYNEEKDCVTRKPMIIIRTKSGDTLYAVFDTDSSANDVINRFNCQH